MFTGIVEEIGTIVEMESRGDEVRMRIRCGKSLEGLKPSDSIAVDGVCFTITQRDGDSFATFASAETMRRTTLGTKSVGGKVNLEPPLTLDKMLGGHLVQGHVDGVGTVVSITPEGDSQMWKFGLPPELAKYLVQKGSVCVDGISLTVVECGRDYFTVAIIPKTIEVTTFQLRKPGDPVNLETDLIGKYVYKYTHPE